MRGEPNIKNRKYPNDGRIGPHPPTVYALIDPRTAEIFYVGVTTMQNTRLAQHVRDSKNPNASGDKRKRVIRDILRAKKVPKIVEIEETTHKEAERRELFWIRKLYFAGAPLTNARWSFLSKKERAQLNERAI